MEQRNASPAKEKRAYGKAPLELDLPSAIEALNRIAQEGRSFDDSKLALVLGNTVTSSAFTRKIRALIAYGLLLEQSDRQYALTDLALSIALPRSPEAQLEATKQAFLRVEQFAFLFNQHKGKLLPADEFLRNIIEQECGIPRDTSDVWTRHFKSGAQTSGLFHSRADGKIQIAESPIFNEQTPEPQAEAAPLKNESSAGRREAAIPAIASPLNGQHHTLTLPGSGHLTKIGLSNGQQAEFYFPDKLTLRDAEKLKKALDGLKAIIESMISESETGRPP